MQGIVVNSVTNKPIEGVSLSLLSPTGTGLAELDTTDAGGNFYFAPDWLNDTVLAAQLSDPNNLVLFYPNGMPYTGGQIALGNLPEVVRMVPTGAAPPPGGSGASGTPGTGTSVIKPAGTPPPSPAKANTSNGLLILGAVGIGLGAYYLLNKEKKKVSGPDGGGFDYTRLIIPVAAVGLGYIVLKPILEKFGLIPTAQDAAKTAAQAAAAQQQAAAGGAKGTQNNTDDALASLSSQITDCTNTFSYDYTSLIALLAQFSSFTATDAAHFLAYFVQNNKYTLYQWWLDKFDSTINWNAGGIFSRAANYSTQFSAMGIPTSALYISPDEFVKACAKFVYDTAGISMQ